MIRIIVSVLIIAVLSACERKEFIIDGFVPSEIFWGEQVYLVALDAPVTHNVDSSVIKDGRFSFRLPADTLEVRILRIAAKFPHMVEDLVVIAEEGFLSVVLDFPSTGAGTPLNNKLQNWKNLKTSHDSLQIELSTQRRESDVSESEREKLQKKANNTRAEFNQMSIDFLMENKENGIGLLMFKLFHRSMDGDTKNEILNATDNLYIERDKQLRRHLGLE